MEKLGNVFSARTPEREAGPGIVFLGHMDTVFPAGTAAARPFRVEGGRAYGPGVADMKAGVVANMFAARALKDLGLIDVPMTLMFSPDEELGAPTATRVYRERISGARAVICAEPGFPDGGVTTERRGSGHFHMRISGISAHAGRCYEDGASAILELAHKIVALENRGIRNTQGIISPDIHELGITLREFNEKIFSAADSVMIGLMTRQNRSAESRA